MISKVSLRRARPTGRLWKASNRYSPGSQGEIQQVPPAFSAIKVEGERAYDLARSGEAVDLRQRPVRIDDLRLIAVREPDSATFEVTCGKGTYVRSLARDMGRALGCLGHVTMLRRLAVGARSPRPT